jgi:hypothetical protein
VHNNFAQADDVFAEDATVEGTDGPIDATAIRKRIYSGILEDLPDASAVHGILTKDGLFDGHISTPLEEYYIEPASRYFTNNKNKKKKDSDSDQPQQGPLFHSVIYKASDVVHPTASPTSEDGSSEPPCKSHELHLRRKEAAAASKASASAASTASAKVPTSSTTSPRTSFSSVIEPRFKSANLLQLQRRKRQTSKEEKQEEEVQEQPLFESMPMPVGPKQEQQRPRRYIIFTKLILLMQEVAYSLLLI